jgi:copper chaperone CopZ
MSRIVALPALLVTVALPWLVACSGDVKNAPGDRATATATSTATATGKLATIELPVEGMTCQGCASSIDSALKGLDGVVDCKASHTDKVARIQYDPSKASSALLAKAITDLGYTVGPDVAVPAAQPGQGG